MDYTERKTNTLKTTDLVAKLFLSWSMKYLQRKDTQIHDDEFLSSTFVPRMLLKKMEVFDINIKLPDELLAIITVCCNENPGISQVILKELLLSIKKYHNGSIPDGYLVIPDDFIVVFPKSFPNINPERIEKYKKLWDEQKNPEYKGYYASGIAAIENLCDTASWWKEAIE